MPKCENCYHFHMCDLQNRLEDYQDCKHYKDKSLIVELPCKVGDTVYTNDCMQGWYMRQKDRPYKTTVVYIGINGKDNYMNVVFKNDNMLSFSFSNIGKRVFLTREEAEKALKEREQDA